MTFCVAKNKGNPAQKALHCPSSESWSTCCQCLICNQLMVNLTFSHALNWTGLLNERGILSYKNGFTVQQLIAVEYSECRKIGRRIIHLEGSDCLLTISFPWLKVHRLVNTSSLGTYGDVLQNLTFF